MPLDFAISALLTLFVVVDPVGLAPTFGLPPARSVAFSASIIADAILAVAICGMLAYYSLFRPQAPA